MRFRSVLTALGSTVVVFALACGQAEQVHHEERSPQQDAQEPLEPPRNDEPPVEPAPPPPAPAPVEPNSSPEQPPEQPPPVPAPAPMPAPPLSPRPPPPKPSAPPEFSRILWVSPTGSDAAAGTEAKPFRTVAKALSLMQPGEAVFLKSGTYPERLLLEERGGGPGRLLTLKAAPGATPVLKGGSGSSTSMVDVRGAYWRIEGLTIDVAGDRAFAAFWRGQGAHHGILRGCTLKNGSAGAGVNIAERASDILIESNHIHHFQRSGDSHGVILQTTARNVVVRGNDIHHNSGDAVQCIGPEGGATIGGTPFDNLLIEDNELHENRENGVDIKTYSRVALRRNTIWGHQRSSSSKGEGVVVHLSARDVTLEDNVLRDNGRGINIGGVRQGPPPTRIIIRRNLVLDGDGADGDEGAGIRVDTSTDVKVQHNTVWNMPGGCLVFGNGDSGPSQGLEVRNNVFAGCALALRAGPGRGGAVVDSNLYFRAGGAAHFRLDGVDMELTRWRQATGLDGRSVERSPGFIDADGGDFGLASGSPARDTGVALGLPFCGQRPDLGARESDCP